MAKRVLVSVIASRWVEVPDDSDEHDVLYATDGVFDGIDGNMWNLANPEIVDEE